MQVVQFNKLTEEKKTMQNETNELDNPTLLNQIPATTGAAIENLTGLGAEEQRRKEYIKKELVKLEHQVWEHEDTAAYTEATAIPPIQQLIDKNRIAIARHEEIIEEIDRSGSKTREDRDRKKASQEDIKLLQKDNASREQLKAQLNKVIESRKAQADEVKLHMKFLATKYEDLFRPEPEAE